MVEPQSASTLELYNALFCGGFALLVDPRSPTDFMGGTVVSAINIPCPSPANESVPTIISKLPPDVQRRIQNRGGRPVIVLSPCEWGITLARHFAQDPEWQSQSSTFSDLEGFLSRYPFTAARNGLPERMEYSFPNAILATPRLYLGNVQNALSEGVIHGLGITHIVNAASEVERAIDHFQEISYYNVLVHDSEACAPELAGHFDAVADFVSRAWNSGGTVLVHCVAGVSRSPTLVAYCLMKLRDMSLADAMTVILACRPQIAPNPGFWDRLVRAELKLKGGYSTVPKEVLDCMGLDRRRGYANQNPASALDRFANDQSKHQLCVIQ